MPDGAIDEPGRAPHPFSGTVYVPESSMTVTRPLVAPAFPGLVLIVTVQYPRGRSDVPHVELATKSPVTPGPLRCRRSSPTFVSVSSCLSPRPPTSEGSNSRVVAENASTGAIADPER